MVPRYVNLRRTDFVMVVPTDALDHRSKSYPSFITMRLSSLLTLASLIILVVPLVTAAEADLEPPSSTFLSEVAAAVPRCAVRRNLLSLAAPSMILTTRLPEPFSFLFLKPHVWVLAMIRAQKMRTPHFSFPRSIFYPSLPSPATASTQQSSLLAVQADRERRNDHAASRRSHASKTRLRRRNVVRQMKLAFVPIKDS